jgi:hypothetical protein
MADESDIIEVPTAAHRPRWDERTKRLLGDWHERATAAQFGHQRQAERTRTKGIALGLPVVIMTTLVGTSAFATLGDATSNRAKVVVGSFSILAAVLASMQTFLGYSQIAERHRIAASRYANSRRAIEVALTRHDAAAVDGIRSEMDKVGGASPQIGRKVWDASVADAREAIRAWTAEGLEDLEKGRHAKQDPRRQRKLAPRS